MPSETLSGHPSSAGLLWPLLVLFCVLLSSGSQVLMKIGMNAPAVQGALAKGTVPQIMAAIATTPFVIIGIAMFGLSAGHGCSSSPA
jgi:hypothetical protein